MDDTEVTRIRGQLDRWMASEITSTEAAVRVLTVAKRSAFRDYTRWLNGAHDYLWAALCADYARECAALLGPTLGTDTGTVPTTESVIEHLFSTVFRPLYESTGAKFVEEMKRKTIVIMTARHPVENLRQTNSET